MRTIKIEFSNRYTALLAEYADSLEEAPLASIEVLGQEMVLSKMPPEEIGEMHDRAIAKLITATDIDAEKIRTASLPLMQLLMSYGVAFRAMLARKEAEEALHLASKAIENTVDSIIITNADQRIVSVNRSFERMTGYSKKEAIGKTPKMLSSGRQDQAFYKQMWESINSEGAWQGKLWNRRRNGDEYPTQLSITAIENDEGVVTNYVGVSSDISEQLSLEQQFQQAQKMEAIGTLVGGIAHDFNNILAGITGNMYLAKRRLAKGSTSEAIDKISSVEDLSMRAAAMISQLLTFARKGIVQMGELSMNSFVKESLKLAQVTIPENIQVIYDITTEDVFIEGDITQLQQLLLNLLNNARDAVEDAPDPRIELRLSRFIADEDFIKQHIDLKGKAFAHLQVSDNGYGISKEHLDQVFDPFFTTKAVGIGTGLGLSMVYGAVQSHAGSVEVESKQGEGTTFHIYLPLIEKLNEEVKGAIAIESAEADGETILLADDETHVRETTAEVLESFGYKVLQAQDGLEAIDLLKIHQGEISLAILDVVMPHLGGLALSKRIREMDSNLPLIFVTGYDKGHVLGTGSPMPHSEILTKPVNFDALSHSIRKLLN